MANRRLDSLDPLPLPPPSSSGPNDTRKSKGRIAKRERETGEGGCERMTKWTNDNSGGQRGERNGVVQENIIGVIAATL